MPARAIVAVLLLALLSLAPSGTAHAQLPVTISVDAGAPGVPWGPTWNWFGADEVNYLTTAAGRDLLGELTQLAPGTPVFFRPHNLLTSGDGTPGLKWGSTGVYTEDGQGHPVYNWRITDRVFDAMLEAGVTPFVEIGFTPEALSPNPHPYRHAFPEGSVFTGWSYPPTSDAKWSALITAWAEHLRGRYGAQVERWQWEVWNEPDIDYFHGTPDQYFHLYDITAAALAKAIPQPLIGGPAVTGGTSGTDFLRAFLDHCANGINAATGGTGAPLTFISFHAKGAPTSASGSPAMGIRAQLHSMDLDFHVIAASTQFAGLPIIISESDPEGCAACIDPANAYRNTPAYGAAILEATARSMELAQLSGVSLEGAVNWSFLFPNQSMGQAAAQSQNQAQDPQMFTGKRSLASVTAGQHGPVLIDKPVLAVLKLLGALGGASSGARLIPAVFVASPGVGYVANPGIEQLTPTLDPGTAPIEALLGGGATNDVGALITRGPGGLNILVWNYSDALDSVPPTPITLALRNLPHTALHMQRKLVDTTHSNAYTAWKQIGSPDQPNLNERHLLNNAAQVQIVQNTTLPPTNSGLRSLTFTLQRNAVTLIHIGTP